VTPEELAWAAGMFEGEGSVRINAPSPRNLGALLCDLPNTDEQVVAFYQQRWPGYMRQVLTPEDGSRRDFWRWRCAARVAAGFLSDVLPYLRTDRVREKALLGLEFQAGKSTTHAICRAPEYAARQRDYYDRMTALNLRGRPHADAHRRTRHAR
jgi:hypothetical protein